MGGDSGFGDHVEDTAFGKRLRRPLANLTVCGGDGHRGFLEDTQDLGSHSQQQRQMAPR